MKERQGLTIAAAAALGVLGLGAGSGSGGTSWLVVLVFFIAALVVGALIVKAVIRAMVESVSEGIAGAITSALLTVFGIVAIRGLLNRFRGIDAGPEREASRPSRSASRKKAPDRLAELKRLDPDFSVERFVDYASTAFVRLQRAISDKDLASAASLLTPALYERLSIGQSQLKDKGWSRRIEDLRVDNVALGGVERDGPVFTVTVVISAVAADFVLDKSGAVVAGSERARDFVEQWTFMRSEDVRTMAPGSEAMSKNCPNCGAPVSMNSMGRCEYCDSVIVSDEFGWVVSRISRAPGGKAGRVEEGRYVIGTVQCPSCGAPVKDLLGVTGEKCWRCGAQVRTPG